MHIPQFIIERWMNSCCSQRQIQLFHMMLLPVRLLLKWQQRIGRPLWLGHTLPIRIHNFVPVAIISSTNSHWESALETMNCYFWVLAILFTTNWPNILQPSWSVSFLYQVAPSTFSWHWSAVIMVLAILFLDFQSSIFQ